MTRSGRAVRNPVLHVAARARQKTADDLSTSTNPMTARSRVCACSLTPAARHEIAAQADSSASGQRCFQRTRNRGAMQIAGRFARGQEDPRCASAHQRAAQEPNDQDHHHEKENQRADTGRPGVARQPARLFTRAQQRHTIDPPNDFQRDSERIAAFAAGHRNGRAAPARPRQNSPAPRAAARRHHSSARCARRCP